MKKLGGGWQYTVYDIGNGRVYKKYKSKFARFFFIFFHSETSIFDMASEVRRMDAEVTRSSRIVQSGSIPLEWLANPVFEHGFDYTQDKVRPLALELSTTEEEKGKHIVDLFIEFARGLLELGYIDLSFRAAHNFGITDEGRIVLMDIGEIVDDPEIIERQRKARYWHLPYIEDDIKSNVVREYYRDEMDRCFGH